MKFFDSIKDFFFASDEDEPETASETSAAPAPSDARSERAAEEIEEYCDEI